MHQYDRLQRILTGKPFHYTVMFFIVACIAIIVVSLLTAKPDDDMLKDFDAVNSAK